MRQGCVFSAGLRFGDWRYVHFTDPDRPDFWRPEPGSVWWYPAEGGALGMRAAAIETVAIEGWIQAEDVVLTGEDGLPLPCLVDIPEVDENGNIVEGTLTPTPSPTPTGTPTPLPTVVPGTCSVTVTIDLALRLSPTRYSPRVATIPLGSALEASYELELEDGSWQEIWYQVNFNGVVGWIAAKIGSDQYATPLDCVSPEPYPDAWPAMAQIEATEIPGSCDIDACLRSEPEALVLARLAYGEAGGYENVPEYGVYSGGIIYSDALRIAWIARLGAFLGLANYGQGYAGRSVSIVDEVLRESEYDPIVKLRDTITNGGCTQSAFEASSYPNVPRMVYPQNSPSASGGVGRVELYELWRIYQDIVQAVIDAPWSSMPNDLQGYDRFKGIVAGTSCPSGADGLSRPGSSFLWTEYQPYPPQQAYQYIDPIYGGLNGSNQSYITCYQDIHHLDDWFWEEGISQVVDLTTNIFPREFCVINLINPDNPNDLYPLAQLRGLDGNAWPTGTPNNPACVLIP